MENNSTKYNVSQISEKLGVPQNTIRRLCNTGLVPYVRRNRLGHRVFEDWQLSHIRIILGLRQAGLKNSELRHYTHLVRQGRRTLPERKALMETQKRQLWQQLEDIQQGIDFLERQTEIIDQEFKSRRQV